MEMQVPKIIECENLIKSIIGDDDINATKCDGRTLLHYFSIMGNEKIIDCLTFLDVNVDAQDKDGNTALHLAIKENHKNIVEELVNNGGVDISLKNNENKTPLQVAVEYSRENIANLLLEMKEDCFIDCDDISNLINIANNNEIVDLLKKYESNISTDIPQILKKFIKESVENKNTENYIKVKEMLETMQQSSNHTLQTLSSSTQEIIVSLYSAISLYNTFKENKYLNEINTFYTEFKNKLE
jgi:ankyrin repeat protein